MTTVIVRRGRFYREVHQAEFFVDGDLCPDPHIAVGRPGAILPGFVAKLSRSGNRIKSPKLFAGPHVESAHQTLGVVVGLDRRALLHSRTDDDDVLDHDRR